MNVKDVLERLAEHQAKWASESSYWLQEAADRQDRLTEAIQTGATGFKLDALRARVTNAWHQRYRAVGADDALFALRMDLIDRSIEEEKEAAP